MAQHGQALNEGTEYPGTGPPPGNAIVYIFGPYPIKGHWITVERLLSGVSSGSGAPTKLATPTQLQQISRASTTATFVWNGVANATGYNLKVGNAVYPISNATSYTITGLQPSTVPTAQVQATGSGNYSNSDYSALATGTAYQAQQLPAPTGLAATPTSATAIGVSWNQVANASGYRLQRATVTNGTVGSYATVYEGSALSYSDAGSASTTYSYQVLALGTGSYSNSGYSAAVQATAYAPPPDGTNTFTYALPATLS